MACHFIGLFAIREYEITVTGGLASRVDSLVIDCVAVVTARRTARDETSDYPLQITADKSMSLNSFSPLLILLIVPIVEILCRIL